MSTAVRVALAEVDVVAEELVGLLHLATERIEVAGSIRRRAPDVGDVELVAVPRRHVETVPGLLEDEEREVDELQLLIDGLLVQGTLAPHPTDPKRGERYAKLIHAGSGLQLDLFAAKPDGTNFGLILLIRTGPARYSQWLVTAARNRGFHVAEGALHRGWMSPTVHARCDVVPTPEEADVYRALGMPYARPEDRA